MTKFLGKLSIYFDSLSILRSFIDRETQPTKAIANENSKRTEVVNHLGN